MKKIKYFLLILLLASVEVSYAQQQVMFTQYMFNGLAINPAYAGSHESISVTGLARKQWSGLDGAPQTQTFSIHSPIKNQKMSLGLLMLHDKIGVTEQTGVYGSYAYRIAFNEHAKLALGLQAGVDFYNAQYSKVSTTDPTFANGDVRESHPSFGFGIYYNTSRFYAGLSAPQLNQFKQNKNNPDSDSRIIRHYFFTTGYVFDLSPSLKLKPNILVKAVNGAPVELDLNANLLIQDVLWIGLSWRSFDSYDALLQIQLTDQLQFGYSYDFATTTALSRVNNGSHEIMINYRFSFNRNRVITPVIFNMKKIFIQCLLLFFISASCAQAQNVMTHLGNYEKRGDKMVYNFSFKAAVDDYKIALDKEKSNEDRIKLKIADCYRMLNEPTEAEKWYAEVINNESLIKPEHKLYYAQALNSNGKYEEAKKWYTAYQQSNPTDVRAARSIEAMDRAPGLVKDSTSASIEDLSINSANADFSPSFYNKGIVFVSDRGTNALVKNVFSWNKSGFLNLYYSPANDKGGHTTYQPFYENEKNVLHEGPVIFYEGDKKMLFTSSSLDKGKKGKSKDGIVKLKLYYAEFKNGAWTKAVSLPFNSNEYSVGHPSITTDGSKLYFVSDMPGGKGGTDIYMSNWQNGQWSAPENLGAEINTEGNEMFPFIATGDVLYFSSNGQGGIGGLDIYKVQLSDKKVINLGAPINSNTDDFGLILYSDGKSGYFTSNRKGGKGDDDIYSFRIRKQQVNFTVFDKKTGKEIPGASLSVSESGQWIDSLSTNNNGAASLSLSPGKAYRIQAAKDIYVPVDANIEETSWTSDQPLAVRIEMAIDPSKVDTDHDGTFDNADKCPEVVGLPSNKGCPEITEEVKKKIILAAKGIFFETGKDIIKPESYDDLDNLTAILTDDLQLNAVIEGHTDNKGDAKKNLDLSQRRANSVKAYLVNKGITAERLTAIGFGANQPIGDNKTTAGRAKNRRVEFKLNY